MFKVVFFLVLFFAKLNATVIFECKQIDDLFFMCKKEVTDAAAFEEEELLLADLENESYFSLDLEYQKNPALADAIWNSLTPYFLPEDHPIKAKLDQFFQKRVIASKKSVKEAGFTKPSPMRFSKTYVSTHPEFKGYIFKFFTDEQDKIEDWKRCLARVQGARAIKQAILAHGISHLFDVPEKYIYPLPVAPSASSKYRFPKHFIVVETELKIYDGSENLKRWEKSSVINKTTLYWVYRLMKDLGLKDSAFPKNMPISTDGKICFVDTEHHHKWPVPFFKLEQFLSSENRKYWKSLYKEK